MSDCKEMPAGIKHTTTETMIPWDNKLDLGGKGHFN